MKVYDLKSDMPQTLEAGKRLADVIREAKSKKYKVIKIIHGYGSTGVGGSIRSMVHKSLRGRLKKEEIKAFIPGDTLGNGTFNYDEAIRTYKYLIQNDSDFKRANDGITFVIL